MDLSADNIYENRRRGDKTYNKSTANGSIGNLLNKTPDVEQKFKKYSERLTMGNDIFTPQTPDLKPKCKVIVNIEEIKKSNDYAGIKSRNEDDKPTIK